MWKSRCFLAAVMLLQWTPSQAETFVIAKPQFSGMVLDDGNYTVVDPAKDNVISRSTLTRGVVYFSFTVIATDKTIEYLREKGRLDIIGVIFADGDRKDTVQFGMDQTKWAKQGPKLLDEYNSEGYFTWRTFMNTKQTQSSTLEIMVRDGRNITVARATLTLVP